ncbi:MAG: PIN domain-containing protein [Cyanobacteria bacterium J06648_10]
MIIVDTGFWVALINKKDAHHTRAAKVLSQIKEPLITTWPVITETCYLVLQRVGNKSQAQFMDKVAARKFRIFEMNVERSLRVSQLMRQYADQPMELADASLVVLAEHFGERRILSTDQRDFNTYRWKNREPFENLMFPTT